MHIDHVSREVHDRLIEVLLSQTEKAVVDVFEHQRGEAHDLVEAFRQLLAVTPIGERMFVLHYDPLSLAADLTRQGLDEDRWREAIGRFNNERKHLFANPFQLT